MGNRVEYATKHFRPRTQVDILGITFELNGTYYPKIKADIEVISALSNDLFR
jgi:hypothetical protein